MNKFISLLFLFAFSLSLSLHADSELNETKTIYQLPDLTVKATLWNSELYKTEQSVSLIEAQSIKLSGSQHFQDLIDSIPNLTFTGGTARPRYFQIRGIGENSQFEGETPDASVRFLIDDFDFTGLGGSAALFNVQQVEVLRGPQAGAFGANAAAGSIQILSKELTKENSRFMQFSLGNDNLRTAALSQSGSLNEGQSDSILYGITLSQTSSDGFVNNQSLNKTDTNAKDEKFALLKFYYEPNNSLTIQPAFIYTNFKNGYDEWSLDNISFTSFSDYPGRDEQQSRGASLKLTSKKPATFSFVSITNLLDTNSLYSYDSDWGDNRTSSTKKPEFAVSGFSGHQTIHRDRENFSQEFRIDSAEKMESLHSNKQWTVGAYFSTLDEYSNFDYIEAGSLAAKVDSRYQTETTSFYAQLASKLSQKSKLEVGFRYEEHLVDFESHSPITYYDELKEGSKVKNKDHLRGAKLAFFNELNSQDTLFASITKGYKSGGANSSSFIGTNDPLSYKPEDLMNYELGISHLSSDQRFRSKINLFYLERENAQIRDSVGTTGLFRYFTTNEGDAQHYGLEYQSDWNVKRNLFLHSEIGLLKAKLDDKNRDLANAPSYSYGLKLLYTPESGYFGSLSLNGSDDYFEENSHNFRRDAFDIVNTSFGFQSDSMTLTFWVNNLFDQNYSKRVFYFDNWNPRHSGARDYHILNSPRTYGIHLSFNW